MKTYLKLAWRNLWRNKRRTSITVASIFFGVFFSMFMSSVQQGSMDNMIENMVRFYSGYIQIQQVDFKETPSINNTFNYTPEIHKLLSGNEEISEFTERIESFALAAYGEKAYGSGVFGIIPEKEDRISGLSKWVDEGTYLKEGENGVLIGKLLADKLELGLQDTLVLLGQGYHGVTAAGKYPVTGIMDFPLLEMNANLIYMDIDNCRSFYDIPEKSTSVVIMLDNPNAVHEIRESIQNQLPGNTKAYTWKEILEEIENLIAGKVASGKIVKGILFMVIGFGIWGTIIMLMAERKREFGIMVALGVKKNRLTYMLMIESFLIGVLGVITGFLGSFPLLYYLFRNPIRVAGELADTYSSMGFEPIIKFSVDPSIFYNPAITVFILFGIIFLYPLWNLKKLKTADALRA